MASSSVSQDDIDNDFEKNSRRSRIRTARARQINPSGCRVESGVFVPPAAEGGAAGGVVDEFPMPQDADSIEDVLPPPADHDSSSPKPPLVRTTNCKDKRPIKLHHVTKVKQQRDRRKLREKRRSTGVVHIASTESTGGSTTGDDDANSSDAATAAVASVASHLSLSSSFASAAAAEVKRNQNESIANSYRKAQEKLGTWNGSSRSSCGSWAAAASSSGHHHHHHLCQLRGSGRRDKSPSDLEADDENDHDSLNQSEGGSGSDNRQLSASTSTGAEQVGRAAEENKRLLSLMEEKDRRIHLLEYKVQQLMRDTLTISEEQSRLQKENSTLLRALSKLTKDKVKK